MSDWLDKFEQEMRPAPHPAPVVLVTAVPGPGDVPRKPARPVYDEATDGNIFAWVLKAAKQVRIAEQAANENQRIKMQIARRSAMPLLVDRGQP